MIRPSKASPDILLNQDIGHSDLSGSLLCINGMKLLARARDDDGIQLTKSGAFFRKFVLWAAAGFEWPGYIRTGLWLAGNVRNESDLMPLFVLHQLMLSTRLIRHYKGRAVLTKAGRAIIGDHGALQAEMFDAYFVESDQHGFSPFPLRTSDAGLRHFLGLFQGDRLKSWVPMSDLAHWCDAVDGRMQLFEPCLDLFSRRIRPALWLGMLEPKPDTPPAGSIEKECYRKTPLCDRFLRFGAVHDGGTMIH